MARHWRGEEQIRILILAAILAGAVCLVTVVSITVLYLTAFEQERGRLAEIVQSRARFIEAVARFDSEHNKDFPGGAKAATIRQLIDAHEAYEGFGRTGEFVVARRVEDQIVFILRHRHGTTSTPAAVPIRASALAEPMRRALRGQSGTVVALDYRGTVVLAAFEPVEILDLGLVAKIDLAEIRAPFVRAGLAIVGVSLLLIAAGVFLVFRIGRPLVRHLLETDALRQSEERLARAQAIAHLGNWDWNIATGDLIWSDEIYRIFGLEPHAFAPTYQAFLERVHPDDREAIEQAVERALANPARVYETVHRVVRPDGTVRHVREMGEIRLGADGVPASMSGVVLDITDQVALEREARDRMAELTHVLRVQTVGEMATSLAHELNQPLTAISTYAQGSLAAVEEGRAPEEMRGPLELIVQSADRASAIIRQLRSYLRKDHADMSSLDLNRVVSGVFKLLERSLGEKGVVLRLNLDVAEPVVMANGTQLEQILVNLVMNGADAAVQGSGYARPTVIIRTGVLDGGRVRIVVEDNGAGLPAEQAEQVFTSFFTTKKDSLGMGLPICKTIVENLGGRIWVDSDRPAGCRFIVELPLAPGSEEMRHD